MNITTVPYTDSMNITLLLPRHYAYYYRFLNTMNVSTASYIHTMNIIRASHTNNKYNYRLYLQY